MEFRVGNPIEVCPNGNWCKGPYLSAKIVAEHSNNTFDVEYKTLVANDDQRSSLIETVKASQLRPAPPEIMVAGFKLYDKVDAFASDGWWVGTITGKKDRKYFVDFQGLKEGSEYHSSELRVHLEFEDGRWMNHGKIGI